jgi:hypothetical protein
VADAFLAAAPSAVGGMIGDFFFALFFPMILVPLVFGFLEDWLLERLSAFLLGSYHDTLCGCLHGLCLCFGSGPQFCGTLCWLAS